MEGNEAVGDVGVAIPLTVHSTRVVGFTTRKADGNVKFKLAPTALLCKDKETLTGFSAKFRHSAVVAALVLTLARPKTTMLRMGDCAPTNPTLNRKVRLQIDDATGFERVTLMYDIVTPYAGAGTGEAGDMFGFAE